MTTDVARPGSTDPIDPIGVDEHRLLQALRMLLVEEERCLHSAHADRLFDLAHERDRLLASLSAAAQVRRASGRTDPSLEAELIALYRSMRQQHATQATVVRRFADRAACAIGVLAQASGRNPTYGADGRVAMRWTTP